MQHHGRRTKKQFSLSKAEKKLMIIFCTFIVFGVFILAFTALVTSSADEFVDGLMEYFTCEAGGHIPNRCSREVFEKHTYPYVAMVSYLLLGTMPITILNYVLDWRIVWSKLSRKRDKPSRSSSSRASRRSLVSLNSRTTISTVEMKGPMSPTSPTPCPTSPTPCPTSPTTSTTPCP